MSTTAKLGDVAPAKPLRAISCNNNEVWHLNLDQIEPNTGQILEEIIAPVSQKNSSTHWFDERHVLYSKLRPYLNKVTVPYKKGIATTELVPLMPDPKRLDREYLAFYLRSPKFVNWVTSQIDGAKMPRVSMKIFWDHEIHLPPLAEQKRIAAILDKADAIRRKRQAAIKLAGDFLRATFLDMFGDPVTNPKGLYLATLGQLCGFIGGSSLPDGIPFTGQDGGVLLMKVGDMNSPGNEIFLDSSREWLDTPKSQNGIAPVSSIILPKRGGAISTNKKRMLLRPSLLDPNLMAIYSINNKLNPFYLFQWFNLFDLTTISSGSAVPQLNKKDLSPLKIICPPIEQQKTFERIFKTVLKLIEKMSADNPERLFNSLTQRAFRGDL